jgi:amino acid transporter
LENQVLKKFSRWFMGDAKNPLDANIFHQLSLIAFLAWVGLGADGLSSSAYGPEEAFRALSGHPYLSLYLAAATAFTVFVISASYSQIIELFPSGGGGYVVASKFLGPKAGLVSGSALVIDYILTVSISIAAAADAIFSNLPESWIGLKLPVAMLLTTLLIWLNMRGIKESIKVLLPIFMVFVISHFILLFVGIGAHALELPHIFGGAVAETREMTSGSGGLWGLIVLLFTAYSLGGGTYTGIEAVANGMGNMAEPRIRTGKKTMIYMSVSLAFTAAGILLCYMLWSTPALSGKTMNAVLIDQVFGSWNLGGLQLGKAAVSVTIWSEALLLFIAAQAGFVDGPTVLSSMAADSWLPHRFANLSNRLVRLNGILFMGLAALAILWFTRGQVALLVVLYSINVFITFSLSQLSMCRHWWKVRNSDSKWMRHLALNGLGLMLTSCILVATTVMKFRQGGWVTLVITACFVGLCAAVKKHYRNTRKALQRLDDMLVDLPFPEAPAKALPTTPEGPTAVLLVNGYSGLGIHAIFSIRKLFKFTQYKNLIFVQVGRIDSSRFKGVEELGNLRSSLEADLKRYVELAQRMGYASEGRFALGIDVPSEITKLCSTISDDYVDPVFFSAKLIFARENWVNRFLHNQISMEIQRRLLFQGQNMVVLPIRVL